MPRPARMEHFESERNVFNQKPLLTGDMGRPVCSAAYDQKSSPHSEGYDKEGVDGAPYSATDPYSL